MRKPSDGWHTWKSSAGDHQHRTERSLNAVGRRIRFLASEDLEFKAHEIKPCNEILSSPLLLFSWRHPSFSLPVRLLGIFSLTPKPVYCSPWLPGSSNSMEKICWYAGVPGGELQHWSEEQLELQTDSSGSDTAPFFAGCISLRIVYLNAADLGWNFKPWSCSGTIHSCWKLNLSGSWDTYWAKLWFPCCRDDQGGAVWSVSVPGGTDLVWWCEASSYRLLLSKQSTLLNLSFRVSLQDNCRERQVGSNLDT